MKVVAKRKSRFFVNHLGNTWVPFSGNTGLIQQQDHYFPFGMNFAGINNVAGLANQYKYNGKEWQADLDLNWYDYGARFYDPQIGRWHSIDPLAENSISMTPYHYVANNPIAFIDPDGLDWFFYKAKGEDDATYHWQDSDKYTHTYSYTDENGKEQTNSIELAGTKSAILFEGSMDESLSEDGKLTGEGANPANVTVFGPGGADDVQSYRGLTVSSDPDKYPMLAEGQYTANYQDMASSVFGTKGALDNGFEPALSYALSKSGSTSLPVEGGSNKATGKSFISGGFIHRTNWSGYAGDPVSKSCLVIDGRQYRRFEKQLGKAMSISVTLRRKK